MLAQWWLTSSDFPLDLNSGTISGTVPTHCLDDGQDPVTDNCPLSPSTEGGVDEAHWDCAIMTRWEQNWDTEHRYPSHLPGASKESKMYIKVLHFLTQDKGGFL